MRIKDEEALVSLKEIRHWVGISAQGQVSLDPETARFALETLSINQWGAIECLLPGSGNSSERALVEAFDEPLVVQHCELEQTGRLRLKGTYNFVFNASLTGLSVDEWDRFHGYSESGVPFVMTREAQSEFFDQLDAFDDESVHFMGHRYPTPAWLSSKSEISTSPFWTQIYQNENPGWETNQPAPPLVAAMPSLRLPKSRVLILGCGSGEDAAQFARAGHNVTALDFSEEALIRARSKFPDLNIQWTQGDGFEVRDQWLESFDLIFEHTFYCAIQPERRNELVNLWRRYLCPGGLLLGIFFTMDRRQAPPFGGSEYEISQRLEKQFKVLRWERCRNSLPARMGKELLVLAQKGWK